mmetsp:Transcript_30141/g.47252  ORF Transcript_30141/g.47252 Transcript_30141/m.47252 type:complete len:141 (+) Transcript_30141:1563-1985(+)
METQTTWAGGPGLLGMGLGEVHSRDLTSAAGLRTQQPLDLRRWRPWEDGGVWFDKNGTMHIDESKPNRWYPDYDHTDMRSPVPGLDLIEYFRKRVEQQRLREEKRNKEKLRQLKRALEIGDLPDWMNQGNSSRSKPEKKG